MFNLFGDDDDRAIAIEVEKRGKKAATLVRPVELFFVLQDYVRRRARSSYGFFYFLKEIVEKKK